VDFLFECNEVSSAGVNKKAVRSNMEKELGRDEAAIDVYLQALDSDSWLQFDTDFKTSPVAGEALGRFQREENGEATIVPSYSGLECIDD
jgi:hypothetical protein